MKTKYFCGYKMHNRLSAEVEMNISIVVTGGNGRDGKQFAEPVRKDGALQAPVKICSADRG